MSGMYPPHIDTTNSFPPPVASPTKRHQVTRSISEFSAFPKRHRLHHHHHHHHHHHTHGSHKKDKDQDGAQNAGPNLQLNSEDVGTTSGNNTPNDSRDASRRTSVFISGWEGGERDREKMAAREGQVAEEKELGAQRASELRNSILDLNALSNNKTRRLDNTYYSVLERLSVLQNNISSMKELATMTKQRHEEFKTESEEMATEVGGQLEAFENFKSQEERIMALQTRVKAGRDKIGALGDRVEVIRDRIEGWEKAELDWQERTRRRLRVLWIIMTIAAILLIGLIMFRYTPARTPAVQGPKTINASAISDFEKLRNETLQLKNHTSQILERLREKGGDKPKDDPRLKIFDEL